MLSCLYDDLAYKAWQTCLSLLIFFCSMFKLFEIKHHNFFDLFFIDLF